jgi:hypothetical protein
MGLDNIMHVQYRVQLFYTMHLHEMADWIVRTYDSVIYIINVYRVLCLSSGNMEDLENGRY